MINCIIIESNSADRKIIEGLVSQIKHLHIVNVYAELSEAKDHLIKKSIDILFLNITTLAHDEVGFLEDLKNDKPKIIVTSKISDVAYKAYDIEAIDFILKPVTVPRLIKAVTKALSIKSRDEREISHNDKSIFIKVSKNFVKITLKDIFLIEALADYVTIHTAAKRYTIHSTMKAMENEMPKKDFIRVHKSSIVRIDQISEIKRESLIVHKRIVKISNTYRKELMNRLEVM